VVDRFDAIAGRDPHWDNDRAKVRAAAEPESPVPGPHVFEMPLGGQFEW